MKVKITDLMDDYYDSTIEIPQIDAPSSRKIKELTMKKIERPPRKKRRIPKGILIAAIFVMLFCFTAGASYIITHQKTVALMETGPNTGGYIPVEIGEKSVSVIEKTSKDINLSVQDSGTTLTMDSLMGMSTEDMSVVYMTFTLTPPEGTVFTADISDCGFMYASIFPTSGETPDFGADGSVTAIDNGDGTISTMLMWIFRGDVSGMPYTIHLEGFGNVSKEAARALYSGERQIEVPGTWEFNLDEFPLEIPQALTVDESLFENTVYKSAEIQIAPFGGTIRFADGVIDNLYGELPYQVLVEYPDGSTNESWTCYLNHGAYIFIFDAPQPVDEASYLVIEDIKIPMVLSQNS